MSLEGRPPPYFFSELRILKDLRRRVFVTAHSKALSARNRGTAHSKGVTERLKVERLKVCKLKGRGCVPTPGAFCMVNKTKRLQDLFD